MLRKRKKFELPRKAFDKPRIIEENKLKEKYGLKNKKELWKANAKVNYFRSRAKSLINVSLDEQGKLFQKLNSIGLGVSSIADVLALTTEDLLRRRLPSIMVKKDIANTSKHARQMVVHKRVLVKNRVVNIPGYLVRSDEENLISIKKRVRKPKVKEEKQEKAMEVTVNA